jgi:hypothetical protein
MNINVFIVEHVVITRTGRRAGENLSHKFLQISNTTK